VINEDLKAVMLYKALLPFPLLPASFSPKVKVNQEGKVNSIYLSGLAELLTWYVLYALPGES